MSRSSIPTRAHFHDDDPVSPEIYFAEEAQISLHYPEEKRISVLDVLLVLVRNRRLIGICVVVFTALGLISALIPEEPEYVAEATVIRESTESGSGVSFSGLGALARGFGFQIGGGSTGLTATAYPEIMLSREVRLAVVRDTFYVSRLGREVTLAEYLNESPTTWDRFSGQLRRYTVGLPATIVRGVRSAFQEPGPPPTAARAAAVEPSAAAAPVYPTAQEERAMGKVQAMISTSVDAKTGLMEVAATTNDPRLSADLISSFLRHLEFRVRDIYTDKTRQNLSFAQTRFAEAAQDLRVAEDEMVRFLDRNTSLSSPNIRVQMERLQRKVDVAVGMYSSLQAQLMQAELELQRSTPVVTVLEEPVPPGGPVGSTPEAMIFFGLVFGGLLGMGLALTKAFIQGRGADEENREKMDEIRSTLSAGKMAHRLRAWKKNGAKQP